LQEVPRDAFPDDFDLSPGASFATEDEDGTVTPFWVVSVVGDAVKITNNHPLAGQNLHFSIEILSIRDATAEEIEHGHPHGEHGHDHHHH
jgi:FKBP-type peptidyl-prolyl cis-trans isomerase SlyD